MPEENDGQQAEQEVPEFKAITSQEELDKLIGARINTVKSKFADYDDLKAKAAKFDEAEEANKSELQKAQDAARAAEDRASRAEQTALRARIAAEMNVPVEVLSGTDEESVKASAQKVLDWANSNKKPPAKPGKLKSGSSGSESAGAGKERAAEALRRLRGTA